MRFAGLVNQYRWCGVLVALPVLLCLASPVQAQDAVGVCVNTSGLLCNLAESPYNASTEQAYVLDLGQYPSSWGNWYGYAPLIRASTSADPIYFTNQLSAQATSRCFQIGQSFRKNAYAFWQHQGYGPQNPESMVTPPEGEVYRFGAVINDFGLTSGNIVSAVAEMARNNFNRLFVTRYESAVNKPDLASGDNAQFGVGGVDAAGNPYFRADNNGCTGTAVISGNNWIYVTNTARTAGLINDIHSNGVNTATDAAATPYVLNNSATIHSPPTVLDCGPAPLAVGANFNNEYVYGDGTPPGTINWSTLAPFGIDNHRGNLAFTHTYKALGNGVNDGGTVGMLGKKTGGSGTDSMVVLGINNDGSPDGTLLLTLPSTAGSVTDPVDGYDPYNLFSVGYGVFDHYHGSIAYRGGNGQVALAGDRNNANVLYAAAVVYYSGYGNNDPFNYIAVCKYDDSNATKQWTIAAWNTSGPACTGACSDPGKAVLDGAGTVIGRLLPLFTVTNCVTMGPSISAPMLDTDGNVYFVSAWEKFLDLDTNGVCDAVDTDSGLFKAHRQPNGGYKVELLISLGNTIYGPNSDTRWAIRYMGVANSSSVNPGTVWSGNMIQDRLPGTLLASLDPFDMGGFIVNISTVYDVDKDGDYERPSGTPDDPDSPDQAYDEAIYVRGYVRTGACCIDGGCTDMYEADCDTNGGVFQGRGSICEFTECATPTPNLIGVVSKGTLCDLTMPIAATGTEPRSFASTVPANTYRQIFTFDGVPPANVIPVKKATTAAPTPVADGSVSCTIVGNTLDCSRVYAPPATYTFDLTGISAGNEQIKVRMLVGEVSAPATGITDGTDRAIVIGVWTGAGYNCLTDLSQDGVTNGTDRAVVIGSWTSGNNTAP